MALHESINLNVDKPTYIQPNQPDDGRVKIGTLWSDTSTSPPVLKICTSVSPITFSAVDTGGGGGGSVPTGTGFYHVTGGAMDAAAKLVDTADINNLQVTFPKIQNVSATSRILGRVSVGAGVIEELTPAQIDTILSQKIPYGIGLINPSGAGNYMRIRFPYAATVTNVRGYRNGGTGATLNARKNGTLNHLAAALSLTADLTWTDGGAVQNTAYAIGDFLELMVVTVAGSISQLVVQVDVVRA